jgi:hypothetical protein
MAQKSPVRYVEIRAGFGWRGAGLRAETAQDEIYTSYGE